MYLQYYTIDGMVKIHMGPEISEVGTHTHTVTHSLHLKTDQSTIY